MFGALWLWVVPLSGQTVSLDTAGAQYRAQPRLIDSLAQRTLVWARRLRLFDWRITVRADSLADAVAQTYVHPDYKMALVIFDTKNADAWDEARVIVHELLHIKISPYTTTARLLGAHAYMTRDLARREEELVTSLVHVLCPQETPCSGS